MNSTLKLCKIGPPKHAQFWLKDRKKDWYLLMFGFLPPGYKGLIKVNAEHLTDKGRKLLGMEIKR